MKITKTMARKVARYIKKYPDNYDLFAAGLVNSRGRTLPDSLIPEWTGKDPPPKGYTYAEEVLILAFTPKKKRPLWAEVNEAIFPISGQAETREQVIKAFMEYAK